MSESSPKSGRYGIFDNRYRYDHIYPRGRSGETLRAWDTQDDERPVVVKRPAPQDAPPMRAAQEVSIRAERKALERLAKHPVLTELRGMGTFRVGGQTHEYIVMDRAEGQIIAEKVLEMAGQGERLPMLEMLVIVDQLLDLLMLAHDQQIVYNDVDTKHLFWDRDSYHLKVIDWGNAVLLDEGGSQGITRQTDIYQVGELLYTIVSGGKRLDTETTPDGDHAVVFGLDAAHVPAALQAVITRATHPNLRKRYTTILELRQQLAEIRKPLSERRDNILSEVRRGLSNSNSHEQLADLLERLEKAAALDPGYPETRRLRGMIEAEQHRLETHAQIDAARIYLDTANWSRAIEMMLDLLAEAGPQMAPVIRFIIAAAELLDTREQTAAPPVLAAALDELLRGDMQEAGVLLVMAADGEEPQLLAERLVALVPTVMLLRPALFRLRYEAGGLSNRVDVEKALAKIEAALEVPVEFNNLTSVMQRYREAGSRFEDLQILLEGAGATGERMLEVLSRSEQALGMILNHLQTVSLSVYSEPGRAGDALRQAGRIDPQNPCFAHLNDYFEEVHLAVKALSAFKPKADGSDLVDWFSRVLNLLAPYGDDLQDEKLHQALDGLHTTAELWSETLDAFILGERSTARATLGRMAKLMEPLNRNIAGWAKELAEKVMAVSTVEMLSPNTALAQALSDAYKVWDQGKYAQVVELTGRMVDKAVTEGEKQAVERLRKLALIPAEWLKANGETSYELTDKAERELVALFLPAENNERNSFAEQMPTENAYLKTMGRGIVDFMRQSSTAAVRILFLHYAWRGLLSVQENDLTGAEFWREAALKAISEGRSNPVFAEFDTLLTGRKLVLEAEAALNKIQSPKDLPGIRTFLNQPLADQWLAEPQRALRQLEAGVKNWEDGDFRAAREAFETALNDLQESEKKAQINLGKLKAWVKPLHEAAASLQTSRLKLEEIAHSTRIPAPGENVPVNPVVEQVLESIVETTEKRLGTDHAHQVRQWLATYRAVRDTHSDEVLDKTAKLVEYQAHFAGLFINRHPTYRLFQIWREVAQNMPDVVHEETTMPALRNEGANTGPGNYFVAADEPGFVDEGVEAVVDEVGSDVYYDEARPGSTIPWGTLIAVVVVIVGVLAFALLGGLGDVDNGGKTGAATNEGTALVVPSSRPTALATTQVAVIEVVNTLTPTVLVETATPAPSATATRVPATDTPSPTPTVVPMTAVPTDPALFSTLPQDVLRNLNSLSPDAYEWNILWFGPGAGGLWQLGAPQGFGEGPVVVMMPPGFLEGLYGPRAAERLMAIEIDMELTLPEAPQAGVFFGIGLENAAGQRASAEIRFTGPNVVAWGITENGTFRERSMVPATIGSRNVSIRLERNASGSLSLYIGSQLLGESAGRYAAGMPLTPVLYTSGGGVFVFVPRLEYEFSPNQ
jgi:tetratricopeptide (TPR) repeat protein